MDKRTALDFLKQHQPMPSDAEMTDEEIQTYEQVRRYFRESPDVETVPLFLNSFGEGSGFGVYQLVHEVLTIFPREDVIPHLVSSLQSNLPFVRFWSADIATEFPDAELVMPLKQMIQSKDFDARYAALTALAGIKDDRVLAILEASLASETDEELRLQLRDAIERTTTQKDDLKSA